MILVLSNLVPRVSHLTAPLRGARPRLGGSEMRDPGNEVEFYLHRSVKTDSHSKTKSIARLVIL